MDKAKLLARINASPVTQSLLYDLGLLPEQLTEDSLEWGKMVRVVEHISRAEADASSDAAKLVDEYKTIVDEARSLFTRRWSYQTRKSCAGLEVALRRARLI